MNTSFEYIYKYIIIGDSGSGKSCILLQYTEGTFYEGKENTVGVEFGNKVINVDGVVVKLQVWDTAGQEQFKSITRSYYRAVAGALVVYDVTSRESFDNVKGWLNEARVNANPQLVVILCGNKIDLHGSRQVSQEEGQTLAREHNILFIECSAKERVNIDEIFFNVAKEIKRRIETGLIDITVEEFGVRKLGEKVPPLGDTQGYRGGGGTLNPPTPSSKKKKNCC